MSDPNQKSFVHLHVHSEYLIAGSQQWRERFGQKSQQLRMPSLVLTDNGNMFGAIEFYFFACLDKNIEANSGFGCVHVVESRVQKAQDRNEIQKLPSRIFLLASSLKGYQNLCQISSSGYQEGFYYKPRIDHEVLRNFNQDVIALTGGLRGEVCQAFLNEGPEAALQRLRRLKEIYGDQLYLEINRTGLPQWKDLGEFLQEASKITGVPLVAANDVHYLERDDQMSQEVLICIGTNKTLQDESRFRLGTDQFYLKSAEQMRALFQDLPDACDKTLEIAERIHLKFELKDTKGKPIYHLPSFPTQGGVTLGEEIARLSREGLELRFAEAVARKEPVAEEAKTDYFQRLDFELSVIDRMGFNGYFLIVSDFINWVERPANSVSDGLPKRGHDHILSLMPKFLRIGIHQSNVSGYTSKAWWIRRSGSTVFLKWGAVEVDGVGDGRRIYWTVPPREKAIRCGTVQLCQRLRKERHRTRREQPSL